MKTMLILGMIVLGIGTSYGQTVHTHEYDGLVIKLMPGQCSDPTVAMLIAMSPKEIQDGQWKAIESEWPMQNGSKQKFSGCWREVSKELTFAITNGKESEVSFLMVFSDQQGIIMTKKKFLKKKGLVDA
jgi:hypothetical protein